VAETTKSTKKGRLTGAPSFGDTGISKRWEKGGHAQKPLTHEKLVHTLSTQLRGKKHHLGREKPQTIPQGNFTGSEVTGVVQAKCTKVQNKTHGDNATTTPLPATGNFGRLSKCHRSARGKGRPSPEVGPPTKTRTAVFVKTWRKWQK